MGTTRKDARFEVELRKMERKGRRKCRERLEKTGVKEKCIKQKMVTVGRSEKAEKWEER